MNRRTHTGPGLIGALICAWAGLCLAAATAGPAQAGETAKPAAATPSTQADRAACQSRDASQDLANCLKEAAAARQAAVAGQLTQDGAGPAQRRANRLARCDALPARERDDCRQRLTEGSRRGTAASGGVLYQHSTVTVGQPAPAASAP